MKKIVPIIGTFLVLFFAGCQPPASEVESSEKSSGELDRTVLPIKEPTYPAITELDARKATPPPRFEVKAPEKALSQLPGVYHQGGMRPLRRGRHLHRSGEDGRQHRSQRSCRRRPKRQRLRSCSGFSTRRLARTL